MSDDQLTSASESCPANQPAAAGASRWVAPALVPALGTFAMGTDSFVLAGILPQIASGLRVSEGSAELRPGRGCPGHCSSR